LHTLYRACIQKIHSACNIFVKHLSNPEEKYLKIVFSKEAEVQFVGTILQSRRLSPFSTSEIHGLL